MDGGFEVQMGWVHGDVHIAHTAGQCWKDGWAEKQHLIIPYIRIILIILMISEICGYRLSDSRGHLDAYTYS